MPVDPSQEYIIFDLETTSTDPTTAEIVQIAAIHPQKPAFMRFVATQQTLSKDDEVWSITKIDASTYEAEKQPLEVSLKAFVDYIGDSPLAGHNIHRYDLPLLKRVLKSVGLELPVTSEPTIDTQRWAQLRYSTPPEKLKGYSLGHLYQFLTERDIEGAHQADKDCEATREVLRHLYLNPPPEEILALWSWLGLREASWYDVPPLNKDEIEGFLQVAAQVAWLSKDGQQFPSVEQLAPNWLSQIEPDDLAPIADGKHELNARLPKAQEEARSFLSTMGSYRPPQITMMQEVGSTLSSSQKTLLEAPTGTGKTRGYLYPALHHLGERNDSKVVIATHTKVLQTQAYNELERTTELGFGAQAVTVKSPRDYICLEALSDALADSPSATEDEKPALGMLAYYVRQGQFDLGAIPAYWGFQPAYREVSFNVQTQSARCRQACPFFRHCAYQTDLRQREQASVWITNQAWLIHHYNPDDAEPSSETDGELHLIIDEGHNLEDVATEAFGRSTSQEDALFHLRRIFDPKRRRGWLRDNRRVPEGLHPLAGDIRNKIIPNTLEKLDRYSKRIENFVKQHGKGDVKYGLSISLGPKLRGRREWPQLRLAEDEWLSAARELRRALQQFPRDSWLGRNLRASIDYLKQQADLLYERRGVLHERDAEEPPPNYIHLTQLDSISGWMHVAHPVDVSEDLKKIWDRATSVTVTSATLDIGDDFGYLKRVLGLPDAQSFALPETLPYNKAHFIVPSHLPEARASNLFRFQPLYHRELEEILPRAERSLSLFTSTARMKEAGEFLRNLPQLYMPLTRREREDVAQAMRMGGPAAALGTRAYMEGVDFPDLKVVNLERIPFPVPTSLLQARQDLAERHGYDAWKDVYLPKALLTFVQAFGRLIRDDRSTSGDGAFILWDKRLLNASYQLLFHRGLPRGVHIHESPNREEFYRELAEVLSLDPAIFPSEELVDEAQQFIASVRDGEEPPDLKVNRLAEKFWGVEKIKDKQWAALRAALAARDLVVLLPTGYGKSLTFQIPALLQGGVTLVVSPLIALMRDQVEHLQQQGLPAAALHSLITGAEQRSILDEVRAGRVNLLYVSPERVNRSAELWNLLGELAAQSKLQRLVLDEAHCLSEWGHNFRPDYLRVADKLREFVRELPISALTATATPKVREDLQRYLTLKAPEVITDSYDRPKLSYFTYKLNDIKKLQLLTQILNCVETHHKDDSVIVYASTRKQTERLAWALRELGFDVDAYHAGLSAVIRNEVQEKFNSGEIRAIVATSAFGMGIDKKNVRAVVHFNPPWSLPAYIQEAGRAGRDNEPAFAILMYWSSDWQLADYISGKGGTRFHHATALLQLLSQTEEPWTGYRDSLIVAINEQLTEDQRDIEADELSSLLSGLQESGAIGYNYRVGKVFLLTEREDVLEPYLTTLRERGFKNKLEGDELDLSTLPSDNAEALNQFLYDLHKSRDIRLYANREPALELSLSGHSFQALHQFTQRQADLKKGAKERLGQIKCYAETSTCKRDFLLQAFGQRAETCHTCSSCDQLQDTPGDTSEPWLEETPFDEALLESVYKPFDTLLEFLESHRASTYDPENYSGLGQTKIVMALQGESQILTSNGPIKLGRREQDNPFFGHLAFIKKREVEKALQKAAREDLLDVSDYLEGKTYRINEAGIAYLAKQRRRRWQRSQHE